MATESILGPQGELIELPREEDDPVLAEMDELVEKARKGWQKQEEE